MITLSQAQFLTAHSTGGHIETVFDKTSVEYKNLFAYVGQNRYSSSIFKDGKRSIKNCIGFGNVLIYDIDNDREQAFSLVDAVKQFSATKSLIVTTKSHQIKKNGKVSDRYRIILPLTQSMTISVEEYPEFYIHVASNLGIEEYIDYSCKDAARMYQPNPLQEVHYSSTEITLSEKKLRGLFEEEKCFKQTYRVSVVSSDINDADYSSRLHYLRSIFKTKVFLDLLKYDERFTAGNRNNYLYSVGKYLIEAGLVSSEVREMLLWINSLSNGMSVNELTNTIMRSLKL